MVEQDETERRRAALVAAIDVLSDRERRIFEARLLADEPLTLEELATKFNVSRERIRQIEVRAFEKVRKATKVRATQAPPVMLAASEALIAGLAPQIAPQHTKRSAGREAKATVRDDKLVFG